MNPSFADFWKLAVDSKLLAAQQCQQLHQEFSQIKGAVESGSSKTLAEWLVSRNVISRYQATILLAGRPGPFVYGDYRIYERIEKGHLANLFRAVHAPTGHPVILQFLTGALTRDPNQWTAAAREALGNCAIVSPHLQRWLDVVDLTTFKFVVSEDLRGQAVDERMKVGRINPQEACRWILNTAQGIGHLHNEGRVHGDIRPGNIWLENIPNHPGQVKLLRNPIFIPQPVQLNEVDATRADYLAPEFLQGNKEPDTLTDLYALGCTFYTLLAGNPPFAGGTVEQKMKRHATEAIRPLEQFGIPQPIAQLVTFLMAKNPGVRYQQASVVAEQLTPFVDPQILYLPMPPAPQTLAPYEAWIQQKRAVLAAKANKASAALPPTAAAPQGPAIDVGVINKVGKIGGNAPILKPKEGAAGGSAATSGDSKKTKQLIYGLLGAGALAVIVLIALNMGGGGKEQPIAENNTPQTQNTTPTTTPQSTDSGMNTSNVSATSEDDPKVTPPPVNETNTTPGTNEQPKTPANTVATQHVGLQQSVVPDDGKLLWASPTEGAPIDLRGVPLEGQLFVVIRPADLLQAPEGERVLAALGPDLDNMRQQFEKNSHFLWSEVEQLIVSFHNNEGKFPSVSMVAYPVEPMAADAILEKLGNPSAVMEEDGTYYAANGWGFAIPDVSVGPNYFVMGEPNRIKESLAFNKAAPPMRKEVARLLRSTDRQRHLTILVNPNFLSNNDGDQLFAGQYKRAQAPLLWLLGEDLQAASMSMHFGDQFYWEVRFLATLSRDKHTLASEFKDRMQQIPELVLNYISEMNPPQYWRKLAIRFPPMISQLHAYTRVGVEDEAAVLNGVMPGVAAHNLILGSELAIVTAPGAASTAVATTNDKPVPKSVEEVLNVKTSFAFDNTSLEFAMRDLAAETRELTKGSPVEFDIRILGNDLQLDGITRNMSIRDFKQENKPVSEVLTALVMKTSTNTDPASPEQKLIWVVAPDPDNPSKQVVLITTRKKAAERGNKLPAIFVEKKT